jgi:carbonic anhydrase
MSDAINRLISGYQHFKSQYFGKEGTVFKDLSDKGQNPKVMVISCSDSRVDPSIILQSSPGELFVVRNVANLIPPCEENTGYHGTSAALEFAVLTLKVEHIIMLGHSRCGGIQALLKEPGGFKQSHDHQGFIHSWMHIADESRAYVLKNFHHCSLEDQARHCEERSLETSLQNLKTFPWIKERVDQGFLKLHAWHFDLESGTLQCFDEESKEFKALPSLS